SAALENGASMGWQACLRGVQNVTKYDAGAGRCTISTAEVLIVARSDPGGGFVTFARRRGIPATPSKARRSDPDLPPKQRLKTPSPQGGASHCAPAAAPRRSAHPKRG